MSAAGVAESLSVQAESSRERDFQLVAAAVALNIVGYPLAAAAAEILVGFEQSRLITIPFRIIVLVVSLLLIIRTFDFSRPIRALPFWAPWYGFWLAYIGRLIIDALYNADKLRLPPSEYFSFAVAASFIPAISLGALGAKAWDGRLPRLLLWVAALGLIANLALLMDSKYLAAPEVLLSARLETKTLNAISFGHLAVSVIILGVWTLATARLNVSGRLLIAGALTAALAALVVTSSRGPALSLLAVALAFAVAKPGLGLYAALISIVMVGFATLAVSGASPLLLDRLTSGLFEDTERQRLLAQAFDLISRNPLLGAGVDPIESYPHNLVVESVLVNGVLFGAVFICLLTMSLYCCFSLLRRTRVAWLPALFLQNFVGAMFSGNLYASTTFWCLMAAVVSAYVAREQQLQATERLG